VAASPPADGGLAEIIVHRVASGLGVFAEHRQLL